MLYKLLRPDESIEYGLSATYPLSDKSVFEHIINRSNVLFQSQFITTCGSLKAVFALNGENANPRIAKIWEKNLPVVKIDLRTKENWAKYCAKHNGSVNNDGCKFDEVLLVGYIPETHVELLTNFDFPA